MTGGLSVPAAGITAGLLVVAGLLTASADAGGSAETHASATWSATTAAVESVVTVAGTIEDEVDGRRRVVLQQKTASGWRQLEAARTTSEGGYAFTVPTDWLFSTRMRVLATRTRKAPPGASPAVRLTVTPGYVPGGSPAGWAPTTRRYPTRIDPCRTVRYRLNDKRGRPERSTAALATHSAVAAISEATGVQFDHVGGTTYVPGGRQRWPAGTDLVVAWAAPADTRWKIGGSYAASGGGISARWARDARGRRVVENYRSGVVVDALETDVDPVSVVQVLMHELGHVMGLGHVAETGQHMSIDGGYDVPPLQWGAGDLTGLRKVGLMAGCLRRR